MHNAYLSILLFGLGVILQSLFTLGKLLLNTKIRIYWIAVILGSLLFSMAIFYDNSTRDLYSLCILCVVIYMMFYTVFFSKNILPIITSKSLLIFNIIFLFDYFNLYFFTRAGSMILFMLTGIVALMSFCVVLNSIIPFHVRKTWKVIFYAWYLIMAAVILLLNFHHGNVSDIFYPETSANINWFESFSIGMLMFYLGVDLFLYRLLPLPDKGTGRLDGFRDEVVLLDNKFIQEQRQPLATIVIAAIVIICLAVNHCIFKFNEIIVANISLLVAYFIFGGHSPRAEVEKVTLKSN